MQVFELSRYLFLFLLYIYSRPQRSSARTSGTGKPMMILKPSAIARGDDRAGGGGHLPSEKHCHTHNSLYCRILLSFCTMRAHIPSSCMFPFRDFCTCGLWFDTSNIFVALTCHQELARLLHRACFGCATFFLPFGCATTMVHKTIFVTDAFCRTILLLLFCHRWVVSHFG